MSVNPQRPEMQPPREPGGFVWALFAIILIAAGSISALYLYLWS